MKKIPMLERFAAQSLVEHEGELIFSKEKFAELIVRECIDIAYEYDAPKMSGPGMIIGNRIEEHFGVEE
jgi:hypothetical protein